MQIYEKMRMNQTETHTHFQHVQIEAIRIESKLELICDCANCKHNMINGLT